MIVLTACGSTDSASDASGAPEVAPSASDAGAAPDDAAEATTPAATEVAPPADGGDGYTTEDSGTGLVRVDGVEYPGFAGDCFVHRGLDPESYAPVPVGDLATPGLTVVVGIDNVASAPAVDANFIMTSETAFSMVGIGGPGTIDSISYVGPQTPFGAVDLALVAFSGTTDDGAQIVAEVVCEVGLG